MNDDLYTIGRMCAEFDVTPRTLGFYESKELLFPKRDGTRRLFTRACRARLRLILQGKVEVVGSKVLSTGRAGRTYRRTR